MEIPPYPLARELTLGDKPLLDEIFFRLQPRVSELTFAGLYLFRLAHAYRLTGVGDHSLYWGAVMGGRSISCRH
ncbi:MAG: hypothetical protein WA140_02990 [Geobacteraceae bacterium]